MNIKDKPKIIISSYDDLKNPYYAGGGAVVVHEVFKRLKESYKVKVITGKYPGSIDENVDGVVYERIGTNFFGPRLGQLVFQVLLPFYVLTERFDLWVESFTPPFSTAFLPLFSKKPVVGLVHMLAALDMQRKYKLPFTIVENFGLAFYKNFIVVNEETEKKIRKVNSSSKIYHIPNGVDLARGVGRNKGFKHVLFLGRIEVDQKGLDLLLKSYSLIFEKIGQKLVIAGQGSHKELAKLKKLIKEFGLTNNVDLVGRVVGRRKEKILENASVVAVPSRYETFSMVALEALAAGKPVISFDIPGLRWLSDEVSIKIKPFGIKSFANGIKDILENYQKALKMTAKARAFVKNHSWDRVYKKYEKVIENLLDR